MGAFFTFNAGVLSPELVYGQRREMLIWKRSGGRIRLSLMTYKKEGLYEVIETGSYREGEKAKRFYGWVPDLPDDRDYLHSALRRRVVRLPKSVDLRAQCSNVEDQVIWAATANALAGALEFLERKDKVNFVDFSRLFICYNERVIEHSTKYDSGAMIRDGIKTLAKQGVCTEKKWPYIVSKFAMRPPAACYKEALSRQISHTTGSRLWPR